MYKNVAGQKIGCQMTSATDGSNFTGAVTVYITGDGGTQAVGSVGAGACTHEGKGYHTYAPSQAETNYDLIAFTFEASGAVTVTVQAETVSSTFAADVGADVADAVLAEIGSMPTASEIAAQIGSVSAANVDTDHTWCFSSPTQVTAPKILAELIGFVGLVAMDFTEPMPRRSSIHSITSATFANTAGTEPTVVATAISTDKRQAHVTLNAAAATAGTYTLTVTIVTTDSQTFVRKGTISIG